MSKTNLYTGVAVALAVVVVAYFFFMQNLGGQSGAGQQDQVPGVTNSVVIQDIKVGTGVEAVPGSNVQVSYIGKLQDGTIFDQSSAHGGPYTFLLGAGNVIPGWDQGIQGMKVGGERVLIVPPSLGYGAQANGPIPANSTLVFDVQLVGASAPTSTPSAQ